MGGSLGLAARKQGIRVMAYARRERSRAMALERGLADVVFDNPVDAVDGAELVILCTPILTMPELVTNFRQHMPEGCIVTDVGSTKTHLTKELDAILKDSGVSYVGSHPMAGSEKSGMDAADANLYQDALVFVTLSSGVANVEARKVADFWRLLGSRVEYMTPQAHDEIVARTSHLPHLVAAALINTVSRESEDITEFCGSGLRDTTRIAEGSEDVWHDIIKSNHNPLLAEINAYISELEAIKEMLEQHDFEGIRKHLATARQNRMRIQLTG